MCTQFEQLKIIKIMLINNFLLDISLKTLSFDKLKNANWVKLNGLICNLQPVRKIIYMCVFNVGQMFSRIHSDGGRNLFLNGNNFIPQLFLKRPALL